MSKKVFSKKYKIRDYVIIIIRILLILSIVINTAILISFLIKDHIITKEEILSELSEFFMMFFFAMLTLILTFVPDYIVRRNNIYLPEIIDIIIILFIFAGIFLSVQFDLYYRFFWWDDFLHTLSGVVIGFIGFIFIYKINYNYSINLRPLLVAIFSFNFAVTIGVLWEILEFVCDMLLETANQKWNLPPTEIMMGKAYQGSGLRDTMSDLILDSVGALFTSVLSFFLYKKDKKRLIRHMEKILNNKKA